MFYFQVTKKLYSKYKKDTRKFSLFLPIVSENP